VVRHRRPRTNQAELLARIVEHLGAAAGLGFTARASVSLLAVVKVVPPPPCL
jgi:hypothetical protein